MSTLKRTDSGMVLSDHQSKIVGFARWCVNNAIDPADAMELVVMARRAFKAGERHCNIGSDASHAAEQRAGDRFEAVAMRLGFTVQWPGLWPSLQRKGVNVYMPDPLN